MQTHVIIVSSVSFAVNYCAKPGWNQINPTRRHMCCWSAKDLMRYFLRVNKYPRKEEHQYYSVVFFKISVITILLTTPPIHNRNRNWSFPRDCCRGAMNNKVLGLWSRRGLLAYVYTGVSVLLKCLSGGKVALIYYGSVALTFTVRHPLFSVKFEPVLACA